MKNNYNKIIGSTLLVGAFLILAFGSDDSKKRSSSDKKSSTSSSSSSRNKNNSTRAKVTFSEAEAFMQNRCKSVNQTLMRKKSVYFNGTQLYMFLSLARNGQVCISSVSENALEVLAADCGPSEIKYAQWNDLN